MKICILKKNSSIYPQPLQHIYAPPEELYAWGNVSLLYAKNKVALVGSKMPSSYGYKMTCEISKSLVSHNICIISDLSSGIASAAHTCGVYQGLGLTIGVLSHGLGVFSSKTEAKLCSRIVKNGGVILSEYKPKSRHVKGDEIRSARIISGLCRAIIIIEAKDQEASLKVVEEGLSQGKDIYALPGPIDAPLSQCPNKLIKMGAVPITGIRDLIQDLKEG